MLDSQGSEKGDQTGSIALAREHCLEARAVKDGDTVRARRTDVNRLATRQEEKRRCNARRPARVPYTSQTGRIGVQLLRWHDLPMYEALNKLRTISH